jgi:hypothetical protein
VGSTGEPLGITIEHRSECCGSRRLDRARFSSPREHARSYQLHIRCPRAQHELARYCDLRTPRKNLFRVESILDEEALYILVRVGRNPHRQSSESEDVIEQCQLE